jgi:hypothetical protein
MVDVITDFIERIVATPQPLLSGVTCTIRLDLEDGRSIQHWYVSIDRGTVTADHRKAKAEAIIHLERGLFERLVTGRANAMASLLRGLITLEGDSTDLVALQRVFPGPPRRKPPAPIPSSEVRGPTSAVAQKPPKSAPKRAAAATRTPAKRAVTVKTSPKAATKARAKRSGS